VAEALTVLRGAGCRITQARTKLLTILGQRTEPITVEDLHEAIGAAECDLVTVYRCLTTFEQLGLVVRTYRHSGTTLYERKHGQESPYRIVCKISNRVTEVNPELAVPIRNAIRQVEEVLRAQGYGDVSHVLEFFVVDPAGIGEPSTPPIRG
jgi:Fur family ferric uptake transcriptional regulator